METAVLSLPHPHGLAIGRRQNSIEFGQDGLWKWFRMVSVIDASKLLQGNLSRVPKTPL
jgi:hypothetical protein